LRSVVVGEGFRGQGLGRGLTQAALHLAGLHRANDVYLLTTSAREYFPRFGFAVIGREEVPPTVRTSVEFTTSCPATAVAMRASLASRR
jgi:amino-acid N-acetyltransferase